jgi:hypothetical protein
MSKKLTRSAGRPRIMSDVHRLPLYIDGIALQKLKKDAISRGCGMAHIVRGLIDAHYAVQK